MVRGGSVCGLGEGGRGRCDSTGSAVSSKVLCPLDRESEDSDVGDVEAGELSFGVVIVDKVMVFVLGRGAKRPWSLGWSLHASVR